MCAFLRVAIYFVCLPMWPYKFLYFPMCFVYMSYSLIYVIRYAYEFQICLYMFLYLLMCFCMFLYFLHGSYTLRLPIILIRNCTGGTFRNDRGLDLRGKMLPLPLVFCLVEINELAFFCLLVFLLPGTFFAGLPDTMFFEGKR